MRLIILLLLFSLNSFSQTERYYALTSTTGVTLTSVTDISSFDQQSPMIHVIDSIRGGTFFLYIGSDAADNGMIFTDANNNKWKRQVNDDKINVLWYGAKGDGGATDNIIPFESAREYIRTHPQFKTLKVPFYNNPVAYNRYVFSRTFVINLPIKIEGQGVGPWQASRLYFPSNTTGLLFQPFNSDFSCGLEDINIENGFISRSLIDSSKALIVVHSSINMKNVKVLYATGNGIEVSSDSGGDSTTNPTFGNAGFSSFTNVRVYESLNGIYIVGSESNAMQFTNCVLQANVRWGILDDGFLGNTYYTCNFQGNSNNALSGAATTVSYAGKYYAALPKHDDGTGVGKRPDLDTNYWLETGGRAAAPWDTTKHYWSGGSYYVKNANATTKFYQPYVEGDNAPFILNSRSESDGGIDGVGYGQGYRSVTSVGGHYMNGTVTIPQSSNPANRFGFGVGTLPDNTTMTHFKNKSGYNTISTFEGYNTFAFNNYKNTSGTYSVGYLNDEFRIGSTGNDFRINSTRVGWGTGATWNFGTGSPEGVITAIVGSFYSRTNGGTGTALYIKETGVGNTGWVAATFGGGGITQQTLNDTAAAIRAAIPVVTGSMPVLITLANNYSSSSTTRADVTGWNFPVTIGKTYKINIIADYQSSQATTTGGSMGIILSGGAAGTVRGSARGTVTSAAAATELVIPIRTTAGAGSFLTTSGVNAVNTPHSIEMTITFICTASGTFNIQWGSEVNASETRLNLGSSLIYQILN